MELLVASAVGRGRPPPGIYLVLRAQTFPVVLGPDLPVLRGQRLPVRHGPAGGRPAADHQPRRATGYTDPAAAGAGADRDRDLVRHDGAARRAGAARLSRDRPRPCRRRSSGTPEDGAVNHWLDRARSSCRRWWRRSSSLPPRYDIVLQRVFSIAATVGAARGRDRPLRAGRATACRGPIALGNWPAPFGIVLVLDRLSALMLLLTARARAWRSCSTPRSGWDRRGRHFHALFQFQLMGLNGAFLTGDVFNLFVFFEVLLIASYGLMLHGAGAAPDHRGPEIRRDQPRRLDPVPVRGRPDLRASPARSTWPTSRVQGAAGARVRPGAAARWARALLLVVFAIKAALVPLHLLAARRPTAPPRRRWPRCSRS